MATWMAIIGLIGAWVLGYFFHDKIAARLAAGRGLTRVVSHRPSKQPRRPRPVETLGREGGGTGDGR